MQKDNSSSATTMKIVDAALRNGDSQLRRNDIREGILFLPPVHLVTQEELGNQQILVLGAEYPEFLQPNEEHNRFMAQSSQQNPVFHKEKEEFPVPKSCHDYVQWLRRKGSFIEEIMMNEPAFLKDKGTEIQSTSRILMKLADELAYLPPGNESHLGYDIIMRQWRMYWNHLIAEMKTVDASFPEISCSGVYVLTTWPYAEFLKTLALTLCNEVN